MDMHAPSLRRLVVAVAGLVFVSLQGCALDGNLDIEGLDTPESAQERFVSLEIDFTEPEYGNGEAEAEGLVAAPEEVVVYVGDELLVELTLADPGITRIVPGSIPQEAIFHEDEIGATVTWRPRLEDVGEHDFIFLIVDADEENLVLGTASVIVSVLPRFGLIEYGF
jgi:hypothetical protein